MKIKNLISVLFAVVIVFIALPVTASAATFTWNDAVTASSGTPIAEDSTITVVDGSTGTINFSGGTLTVTGTNNTSGDLILNLSGATTVNWNAAIYGSGTVTITGTATNVIIRNEILTDNSLSPALTIGSGIGNVDMSGRGITNANNKALVIGSPAVFNNCPIQSPTNTAIETSSDLTLTGCTISGLNGIKATSLTDDLYLSNCWVETLKNAIDTVSNTTIDNSVIETTYVGEGSEIQTISAGNSLLIMGENTKVQSKTTADKSGGIGFYAEDGLLEIRDGLVFGTDYAIAHTMGDIMISGGEITSYSTIPIYGERGTVFLAPLYQDRYTLTITGGSIYSEIESAIYLNWQTHMTINMSDGTVEGVNGIYVYDEDYDDVNKSRITLSGGTITSSTGSAVYIGGNTELTISGATLNGTIAGVHINDPDGITAASLLLTSGSVSGGNYGINSRTGSLNISPTTSKSVTIRGTTAAIVDSSITPNYSAVRYALAGENFNGSDKTPVVIPFANSSSYRYLELMSGYGVTVNGGTANGLSYIAVAPGQTVSIAPTASSGNAFIGWTASGIALSDPTDDTQSFIMPSNDVILTANYESITYNPGPSRPSYYTPVFPTITVTNNPSDSESTPSTKKDYILVIATLNKSGTVNSAETAEDMTEAHKKALAESIKKIYLKIPTGGTGISKSAMKAVYKAAGGTKLYFTFGFYELKDDGETEEDVGTFFFPLSDKSGQILTGIRFVITNITPSWNTDVLGSFETTHKGGWGETATVSMSIDKLGFAAENGERVYALIYDTKAKKYYQTTAKIEDGFVTFKTSQSGIVTIVTRSIK
jgi:hypothetical protein